MSEDKPECKTTHGESVHLCCVSFERNHRESSQLSFASESQEEGYCTTSLQIGGTRQVPLNKLSTRILNAVRSLWTLPNYASTYNIVSSFVAKRNFNTNTCRIR